MDEIDEKLQQCYDYIRQQEVKILSEVDKSENRSSERTKEKLEALRDLINSTTTARHDTVNQELSRMQKDSGTCLTRCSVNVAKFDTRILNIETRLTNIEVWRKTNWQKILVYVVIGVIAAVKVLEWAYMLFKNVSQ